MIYTMFVEDYSSSDLIAIMEGPINVNPEEIWKSWMIENVHKVVGYKPAWDWNFSKEQKAQHSMENDAWFASYIKRKAELAKQYKCKNSWQDIAVEVLCRDYGFKKLEYQNIDIKL